MDILHWCSDENVKSIKPIGGTFGSPEKNSLDAGTNLSKTGQMGALNIYNIKFLCKGFSI